MNKKNILIVISVSFLLLFNFLGKSYFRQRNAVKTVRTVLTHWKNNDLTLAMSYWEEEKNSPPVYDLMTYEIGKKQFDKKDKVYHARIAVILYFPPDNRLPSEKEWIFELNKTRYGWKIIAFRLSGRNISPQA